MGACRRSRRFETVVALVVLALGLRAQSTVEIDAGRGPLTVHLPADRDPDEPVSLLLVLHGYAGDGALMEASFAWQEPADFHGMAYVFPEGLEDAFGFRYWNGTDACCDFLGSGVDDVAYLDAVIDAVSAEVLVDPRRVHVFGHSNGGFMAHRFACEAPGRVASVASMAGMTWLDTAACQASEPVHVLQIHGELDPLVPVDGGALSEPAPMPPFPSAIASIETWAAIAGCSPVPDVSPEPLDLDAGIGGAETEVTRWVDGCDPRGSGELWMVGGGDHVVNPSPVFVRLLFDWFAIHPQAGTWDPVGEGLPGVAGTPSLSGSGVLLGDDLLALTLADAAPVAPTWMVVGFAAGLTPFKGGTMVPSLDALTLVLPFTTGADGGLVLEDHWPAGLPSGFSVWFQAWILDAVAVKGVSASAGVVATTP